MPVNFFDAHHTQSTEVKFGLYDDCRELKQPAVILDTDIDNCQGIVHNPAQKIVDFYGLDHSISINKPAPNSHETESLCDGMLQYENNIAFVELKNRQYSGWLVQATDQLINTTKLFSRHHNLNSYNTANAYVCNTLRPKTNANHFDQIQRYRKETEMLNFRNQSRGLEMNVQREIMI